MKMDGSSSAPWSPKLDYRHYTRRMSNDNSHPSLVDMVCQTLSTSTDIVLTASMVSFVERSLPTENTEGVERTTTVCWIFLADA